MKLACSQRRQDCAGPFCGPQSYPVLTRSRSLQPAVGPRISLAQGGNAALQDGQNGGLPWWAWALIGAGVATAAMQLEFGDEANEGEDD